MGSLQIWKPEESYTCPKKFKRLMGSSDVLRWLQSVNKKPTVTAHSRNSWSPDAVCLSCALQSLKQSPVCRQTYKRQLFALVQQIRLFPLSFIFSAHVSWENQHKSRPNLLTGYGWKTSWLLPRFTVHLAKVFLVVLTAEQRRRCYWTRRWQKYRRTNRLLGPERNHVWCYIMLELSVIHSILVSRGSL